MLAYKHEVFYSMAPLRRSGGGRKNIRVGHKVGTRNMSGNISNDEHWSLEDDFEVFLMYFCI